jgi:hypothetical protein
VECAQNVVCCAAIFGRSTYASFFNFIFGPLAALR